MRAIAAAAALTGLLTLVATAQAQDKTSQDYLNEINPAGPRLGIKHSGPSASAAPGSAANTQPNAPTPHLSSTVDVQFATGSAELTGTAMRKLDQLGRALSDPAVASYRFRIEGHTDTVGAKDLNQALSERRAEAVAAYLRTRFAIPAERLQAVGVGSDGLAVQTGDQVAEPRNRRVLIVNLDA